MAARKKAKAKKTASKRTPRAKRSRAAKPRSKGERSFDAAQAFRIAIPLTVLAAIVVGVLFGVPELERSASRRIRAEMTPVLFDLPVDEGQEQSWMREEFLSELHRVASEQITEHPDVLDPKQLREMREAIVQTGWFKSGPVLKRVGDSIHVSGEWRVPAAAVRYEGREYLVAWGGELLPKSFDVGEATREGLAVISGAIQSPPADELARLRYGERWRGNEVRAALRLLQTLFDKPYIDQIDGIAVEQRPGAPGSPKLVILTDQGGRVVWGVQPTDSGTAFGEVDAQTKLDNLARLYEEYGRIDAGRREVTVYGAVVGERGG
jgi:hypothetical protein